MGNLTERSHHSQQTSQSEIQSLRDFNAELLERIGEFRKRNLDLSKLEEARRASELEIQRLREIESALRTTLTARERECSNQAKRLEESTEGIQSLQKLLDVQKQTFSQFRDELNRKLAKLTDENWAKDLEAGALRRENGEIKARLEEIEGLGERLQELRNELDEKNAEIERREDRIAVLTRERNEQEARARDLEAKGREFEERITEKESQIGQAGQLLEDLEKEIESTRLELQSERDLGAQRIRQLTQQKEQALHELNQHHIQSTHDMSQQHEQALRSLSQHHEQALRAVHHQHAQQIEVFRVRETQMQNETASVRAELANLEKRHKDACDGALQLRASMESLKRQHMAEIQHLQGEAERHIGELKTTLQADFQKRFEVLLAENHGLKQRLETRETKVEADRAELKKWEEQLKYLEQYLRQSKDALKRERSEVLRMAKQFVDELAEARNHPYGEYLELTEFEVAKLQSQLANTSALSPLRSKLEERLATMLEQSEFQRDALNRAKQQIEGRLDAINSIIKSASPML
jgi:chromosome segregation ATPase